MANRERNERLQVLVTEEEKQIIEQKMALIGTTNFSQYARKMLIDGYIIKRDFREMKDLNRKLGSLASSINQIAKRVNETRNIYEQDIEDLRKFYYGVKSTMTEQMVKMSKKEL